MSRDRPSQADLDLAQQVRDETRLDVSARQIRRWANAGLISFTPGSPGRGRGYSADAVEAVVEVANLIGRDRRTLDEATVILFFRGRPVPESIVRTSYGRLLTKAQTLAEHAVDPLLDEDDPQAAPARWTRAFSRTPLGRMWRKRLRGAPAEWESWGEPVTRPSDRHHVRTLRPARALRGVMTVMTELMLGEEPNLDAQRLLHRAMAVEDDLELGEIAANTASIEEMPKAIDEAPLASIRAALDWVQALPDVTRLLEQAGAGEIVGAFSNLPEDELHLALGAIQILAQWQPSFEPPEEIHKLTALGRLALAVNQDQLSYILLGPEGIAALDPVARSEIEAALQRLATDYPEEANTVAEMFE